MNYIIALIGAGLAGICIALEPTVNSGLGKVISFRLAAFHSFLVGTLLLVIINLVQGGFKEYKLIVKTPPYLWIGGILGMIVVYVGARSASVLGIASALTIMVAVQLVTSILLESFGLFGMPKSPVDFSRIVGVVLLIVAVKLIVKG